jgi:opine dehydrogenase
MSLIPIASLGNRYGVSVRGIDSLIRLACIAHRTDYWRKGRTLEKLGIDHLSVSELTHYVKEETIIRKPIQSRRPDILSLSGKWMESAHPN